MNKPFVRPFDALAARAGLRSGTQTDAAAGVGAAEAPEIPVPPYTELTFRKSTAEGNLLRLESHLSQDGLIEFYAREMPPAGWQRDEVFDGARARAGLAGGVLSFKAGRNRCIIGLEEADAFTTVVTVLLLDPRQRSGTPL